jgi:flagella basal body P-ring formation protein FlgA
MRVYFSIVSIVILCVFFSPYLLGATLALKPEVSVSGEKICLRDILEDTGSISQDLLDEELFPAPSLGISLIYPSGYIKQILLSRLPSLLKDNEIIFPDKIRFTRVSQTLTSDEVFEFIKKDPSFEGLDIVPINIPKIILPVGDLKVEVKNLSSANSRVMVAKVSFFINNVPVRTIDVSLKVTRKSIIYVAKLHIPRGTIITEDLIGEKTIENGLSSGITKEEIIGKVSTRELYPGQIITSSSIAEPPLVKKNEEVEVIQRIGPLTVSVTLIALQDGYLGQTIRLRNPVSFKEVRGTVTGKSKVEVFR